MNLLKWRENNGLSQAEAAKLFEVEQPTLSRYERGVQIPRKNIMERIRAVTAGAVDAASFYNLLSSDRQTISPMGEKSFSENSTKKFNEYRGMSS